MKQKLVVLACPVCDGHMFFHKHWICVQCWTTIYQSNFCDKFNIFNLEQFCDNCHHRLYQIGDKDGTIFFECFNCKRIQFYKYGGA